jgi:hypothetical protein
MSTKGMAVTLDATPSDPGRSPEARIGRVPQTVHDSILLVGYGEIYVRRALKYMSEAVTFVSNYPNCAAVRSLAIG